MNLTAQTQHTEHDPSAGWQGSIQLGFTSKGEKTRLSDRHHQGPLKVQRPFYPEGAACHVYLLHPPGGVVGGDRLNIDINVLAGAHALLTTPGAAKFYRSAGPLAQTQQVLEVNGGILEWLPQENILFPGAHVKLESHIQLDAVAQFIGWEVHCLGRPVISERFIRGRAKFKFSVYRQDRPLLIDRWRIDGPADLQGAASLRNHPVVGSWLATGADRATLEMARETLPQPAQGHIGLTLLDELLVARYLGNSSEEALRIFRGLWSELRPRMLGRDACPPRIWST